MKSTYALVLAILFSLPAVTGFAAEPVRPWQVAALDAGCLQKCEKAKSDCLAQYTVSDSTSGRYVTPEGVKVCYAAFHDCKKTCNR